MAKKVNLNDLLSLISSWLDQTTDRRRMQLKNEFCELVGNSEIEGASDNQIEWIKDLSYDFSYYSINYSHLNEDPALIDTSKMLIEVKFVYQMLRSNGEFKKDWRAEVQG